METVVIESPDMLRARIGQEILVSDWSEVPQQRIDQFAEATGDVTWIHIDRKRAQRESPYGTTIAHGLLTMAISAYVLSGIEMPWSRAGAFYGIDKLRFLAPVPAGGRIRARARLLDVQDVEHGLRITWRITTELEGSERPACVADSISMQFL